MEKRRGAYMVIFWEKRKIFGAYTFFFVAKLSHISLYSNYFSQFKPNSAYSDDPRKLSDIIGKMSDGLGKVSDGLGRYRMPKICTIYAQDTPRIFPEDALDISCMP